MSYQKIVVAALLAGMGAGALAQDGPDADSRASRASRIVVQPDGFRIGRDVTVNPFGPSTIVIWPEGSAHWVKNAPYSAQMVTERRQNLADGNQIAEQHTSMSYRDKLGRTRQEVRDAKGEVRVVTIHDPVAGVTWVLNPRERTAIRTARGDAGRIGAEAGRSAAEAARARVEQMRKDGSLPTVERHKLDDGSEEIIVKRVQRADGEDRQAMQEDVRVQVSRALAANSEAMRDAQIRLAPLTAGAFGDMRWALHATTKDLGTRDFEGVKAEGKLRSYEIPAGAIGNRNPIVVSDETWYAPELQVTVYTKHSDPRSGDVVFHLDKLRREEPPAALFTVPGDYTVTDPLAQAKARAEGKAK